MRSDDYYRAAQLANNGLIASLVLRALKPLLAAADAGQAVPALGAIDKQRVAALHDVVETTWRGSLPIMEALDARRERALPADRLEAATTVSDDVEAFEIMRSVLPELTPERESEWLADAVRVLGTLANDGWNHLHDGDDEFVRNDLQPFLRRLAQPLEPLSPLLEGEKLSV